MSHTTLPEQQERVAAAEALLRRPRLAGPGRFSWVSRFRELMILLINVAAIIGMCIFSPAFRTESYLLTLLLSLAINSIVAVGMTVLMVSGGFDLSVGSTVAMTGMIAAWGMKEGLPVPLAVLVALASGALIGLANGMLIAGIRIRTSVLSLSIMGLVTLGLGGIVAVGCVQSEATLPVTVLATVGTVGMVCLVNGLLLAGLRINAFITTLAMMSIVRGALLVVTDGQAISRLPKSFTVIGQKMLPIGRRVGVQMPIVIALVLVIAGDLLLRKTRFFRQNYYIGGNEKAAMLSGIPVAAVKVFNYTLTGLLAAVAGVVATARFDTASVTAATNLELDVITAVIIGGASLQGGEGTVLGSFLGCLLMAIIVGSLPLLGVNPNWNKLVIGGILVMAVMIDTIINGRKSGGR